jgi:hypothetical protein
MAFKTSRWTANSMVRLILSQIWGRVQVTTEPWDGAVVGKSLQKLAIPSPAHFPDIAKFNLSLYSSAASTAFELHHVPLGMCGLVSPVTERPGEVGNGVQRDFLDGV